MTKVNDRMERVLESYDSANTYSGYSGWVAATGRKLGQLGADVKPCLENIEATFKCRKFRLTAWAYDKLGTAKHDYLLLKTSTHICAKPSMIKKPH